MIRLRPVTIYSPGRFDFFRGFLFLTPMPEYTVYILQSESTGRYYCGFTGDLSQRIHAHNDPEYKLTRTTKVFAGPWQVIWTRPFESRSEAMRLERKIKKRGIGRYLEDVELAESRRWRD